MFHRVHVAASPKVAFAVLGDVTQNPLWQSTTLTSQWTSPPPHGKGSTFRQTHRVAAWTFGHTFAVLDYDPDRLLVYECREGPQPVQVAIRVEPTPSGALVEVESSLRGVKRFSAPLARRYIKRLTVQDLAALRRLLEHRAAQPAPAP